MIHFLFDSVQTGDAAEYIQGLLQRSNPAAQDGALDTHAVNALSAMGPHVVPLAEAKEINSATAEQQATYEVYKQVALSALSRELPLAQDEVIEEEFFSFLKTPFKELPANTPALRRRTNQAVLYFFFDHVQMIEGDLILKPRPATPVDRVAAAATPILTAVGGDSGFDVGKLAKGLASGLVNGVLGAIGSAIFDALFPQGVPNYFGEVYKEMSKIFKQSLTENTVTIIDGKVNGVKQWVENVYEPRKKQPGVTRKELSNLLTPMTNTLYTEAVGPLMEDSFSECGLSVFLVTASMQLALNQEQALVDPDTTDPNKSSYAETVQLNARGYADFAERTFNGMVQQRRDAIIRHDIPSDTVCPPNGGPCHKTAPMWWIEDKITGRESGYYYDDKNHKNQFEAIEALQEQWKSEAVNKMITELGDPSGIAADWRRLQSTPIPKVS